MDYRQSQISKIHFLLKSPKSKVFINSKIDEIINTHLNKNVQNYKIILHFFKEPYLYINLQYKEFITFETVKKSIKSKPYTIYNNGIYNCNLVFKITNLFI